MYDPDYKEKEEMKQNTFIVNIKSGQSYDFYCGRENKYYNLSQSKWANPFVIGKDGDREFVIEKYRLYLNTRPDLLCDLCELKGKILGCWCDFPKENCHCSILHELSESKYVRNWFSNMLPFDVPFIYQKIPFLTVENFYQAMKMPKDRIDLRIKIAEMSPFKSKTAIRDEEKFSWRPDWTKDMALQAMELALRYKFKADTSWYNKLKMTEDWEITEWNNWGDLYWGKDVRTKQGENHLGKILMKIRDSS